MMLMKKQLKHEAFVKTTPGAYAALQKRIEELGNPSKAIEELSAQLTANLEQSKKAFEQKPTVETAKTWFSASTARKAFVDADLLNGARTVSYYEQRGLRHHADSFAVYLPILNKLAELLREDISDSRSKIARSLADVDADAADIDSISPMPSLVFRLAHVESLIHQCPNPAIPDGRPNHERVGLVDSIDRLMRGELPEPTVVRAVYAAGGAPGAKELQRIS